MKEKKKKKIKNYNFEKISTLLTVYNDITRCTQVLPVGYLHCVAFNLAVVARTHAQVGHCITVMNDIFEVSPLLLFLRRDNKIGRRIQENHFIDIGGFRGIK